MVDVSTLQAEYSFDTQLFTADNQFYVIDDFLVRNVLSKKKSQAKWRAKTEGAKISSCGTKWCDQCAIRWSCWWCCTCPDQRAHTPITWLQCWVHHWFTFLMLLLILFHDLTYLLITGPWSHWLHLLGICSHYWFVHLNTFWNCMSSYIQGFPYKVVEWCSTALLLSKAFMWLKESTKNVKSL